MHLMCVVVVLDVIEMFDILTFLFAVLIVLYADLWTLPESGEIITICIRLNSFRKCNDKS